MQNSAIPSAAARCQCDSTPQRWMGQVAAVHLYFPHSLPHSDWTCVRLKRVIHRENEVSVK